MMVAAVCVGDRCAVCGSGFSAFTKVCIQGRSVQPCNEVWGGCTQVYRPAMSERHRRRGACRVQSESVYKVPVTFTFPISAISVLILLTVNSVLFASNSYVFFPIELLCDEMQRYK